MKQVGCATLDGFDAREVDVEVAFVRALPSFSIVGLAQTSIQESRERIKSALSAIDFKFPPQKVTVNLSPSDLRKEGSHFDLPIALLIALQKSDIDFSEYMVFGELGLDGRLKDSSTLFAILLSLAREKKIGKVVIPEESLPKISKIPGLEIYPAATLQEAIDIFTDTQNARKVLSGASLSYPHITIDGTDYYYTRSFPLDFYDIKGQESAKRASLIAACGMHNILCEGSPGCGKSMSAKRLPYILPPMSLDEILEKAKLDALEGKEPDFKPQRNYRAPHHTATRSSIFGGGSRDAKTGEVSLANGGLLFFDEIPHFPKTILESLREPLEDHHLLISRVNSKIRYKTKFLFVAAMNPCPCGNLLSTTKECRCSELEIARYKKRLSSPLLDRIDLYVQMAEITPDDKPSIRSEEMFETVLRVFKRQHNRGQSELNGKLGDREIGRYCTLDEASQHILDQAIMRFSLSQRAINKTLKVARTIADIADHETIQKADLIEALQYRFR
ncbi:MAG TPA: ATP-binding protein, partial [Campylobacteraceae bacterium]|nr:ATP-binding protein [Campylobacteraceae bacterium]